jgi:hypothetical protein
MKPNLVVPGFECLAAVHRLEDGAMALRIVFGLCLVAVFLAGLLIFRKRQQLFGRDSQVTGDTWAARNLRLWQVLLVWILAMDMLITMLFRL